MFFKATKLFNLVEPSEIHSLKKLYLFLRQVHSMEATKPIANRGAFIVLEGCDRCGKSTQSKMLVSFLQARGINVKHMNFPARQSTIGQVINSYLTNKQELSDECIHLLFSANRWEFIKEIKKLLEAGTTLVVDRYSYSGIAYSVAKGLSYEWCFGPEKGLIRPDAVFYLATCIDSLSDRGNYGEERYERKEFQRKVSEVFNRIYEEQKNYWHKIDASLSVADIHDEISTKTLSIMGDVHTKPMKVLQ